MKFSTVNAKSPAYNENHMIYIGSHTGSFKKLEVFQDNPFKQDILQNLNELEKVSKVTCMEYGNNDGSDILVGTENHFVKVFDCSSGEYSTFYKLEGEDKPVVGLGRYNECIVAASTVGQVQVVKYPKPVIFNVGDNISKMRLCSTDKRYMVTGGQNLKNILKVWDINTTQAIFTAKNVRKDMLELEQPVWDCDVIFLDRNCVASCSRHGYVRVYDTRGAQRRPVQDFMAPNDQLTFTCLAANDKYLYAGTATSGIRAYDTRNMKNHVHTYKGFTGSVSSVTVDVSGNYIFSASLDRQVRVHTIKSPAMVYQCYVKSKPTAILYKEYKEDDECVLVEDEKEVDEEYEDLFSKMDTVKDTEVDTKKRKQDTKEKEMVKNKKKKRD